MCVLRTRGRRTGRVREATLDYARASDGGIWVIAGWGAATQWYQNLLADPGVEVAMGRRVRRGTAAVLVEPGDRIPAVRAVLLASGMAGRSGGIDPRTATDTRLAEVYGGFPVIHIRFA